MSALPPGAVIGMLGSGQLGRMTALAAAPLGLEVHVFAPSAGPATQVTSRFTQAAYDDEEALARFADAVDVVTYEFENVPARTAEVLAARVPVRPGPHALATCQHRAREKGFLRDLGVPTAPWWPVATVDELAAALEALGGQGVLKTAELGYDGKGQVRVATGDDPQAVWTRLVGAVPRRDLVLEGFVHFEREASVVVARGLDGAVAPYDLVENEHRDHILHRTTAPADVSAAVASEAAALATRIIVALDYVGVLGVELFLAGDALFVNELAPRPHNSGHWTQDGAVTCQFEQHARAVAGLPLGSPARRGRTVMTNLLGDDVDAVPALLAEPGAHLHLYGKAEARPGRKMGHVNRVTPG
ncbi:MAG: 5-(carboxyamino)imidazole ribonucleotide synthase [Alphaproteobacteria bacterium]|nr:5-(carboxyamino)imidazole ribonucleotide synthase [Alphaproteobacteria bacterium]